MLAWWACLVVDECLTAGQRLSQLFAKPMRVISHHQISHLQHATFCCKHAGATEAAAAVAAANGKGGWEKGADGTWRRKVRDQGLPCLLIWSEESSSNRYVLLPVLYLVLYCLMPTVPAPAGTALPDPHLRRRGQQLREWRLHPSVHEQWGRGRAGRAVTFAQVGVISCMYNWGH
jgi:hypothetical protein